MTKKTSKADDAQVRVLSTTKARLTEPTLANVDGLQCDSIVCGFCSDVTPLAGLLGMLDWRLCGRLSRLLQRGVIKGDDGERVLFWTEGRVPAPRLFLYGWGPAQQAHQKAQERSASMIEMLNKAKAEKIAFAFPEPARGLIDVAAADVERALGDRLVALFAPDPYGPA